MILLCLLQKDTVTLSAPAECCSDSLDPVRKAIFNWLLKAASHHKIEIRDTDETAMDVDGPETDLPTEQQQYIADTLWHYENCRLVAQVSLRYTDFFKAHVDFLVDKTRSLEKKRLDDLLGVKVDSDDGGEGESDACPPLEEQVERVSFHWVELCQAGEHLLETCLPLLSSNSSPFEEHPEELTHATNLFPSHESVWSVVLERVLAAQKSPQN